jgi:flagellar hook-associated protein 3 FlgL
MAISGFSNLAQHMMLSNQTTSTKNDLDRLAFELASGRKADLGASLGGDFRMLNDVESQLTVLNSYDQATIDASVFTTSMQTTLDRMQGISSDLSTALISTTSSGAAETLDTVSDRAKQDFESMVNALNGRIGDKSIFAGAATDGAATISADQMMSHLSTAVAGAVTVNDIITAVDDWFMAPGGGYETVGYIGSTNDLAPFKLNEDESAAVEIKADDMEIRQLLRDTALAAIANDSGLALNSTEKLQLLDTASTDLLTNQNELTHLRADLGYSEERIEAAGARNAATRTSLSMVQNDLVSADATDVAGQLHATQVQLELVYTITARLNDLSLMDYMR